MYTSMQKSINENNPEKKKLTIEYNIAPSKFLIKKFKDSATR